MSNSLFALLQRKQRIWCPIFLLLITSSSSVFGVAFSADITFNEAAFPTAQASDTSITGTNDYNVLDDTDGSELTVLNGDLPDIAITASSSGGAGITYRTVSSGSFTSTNEFTGSPSVNNPGTRVSNTIDLTFADHLSITDFSLTYTSANSGGNAWEFTIFEILDTSGNPLTPGTTVPSFLGGSAINDMAALGVFVVDSRETVLDVGTNNVSSGSSGSLNSGELDYDNFGLADGTQIGGVRITTFLEDTRGIDNGSTELISSLTGIEFSGEIVPEPSSSILLLLGGISLFRRRR